MVGGNQKVVSHRVASVVGVRTIIASARLSFDFSAVSPVFERITDSSLRETVQIVGIKANIQSENEDTELVLKDTFDTALKTTGIFTEASAYLLNNFFAVADVKLRPEQCLLSGTKYDVFKRMPPYVLREIIAM